MLGLGVASLIALAAPQSIPGQYAALLTTRVEPYTVRWLDSFGWPPAAGHLAQPFEIDHELLRIRRGPRQAAWAAQPIERGRSSGSVRSA
jgi:hypothetical protein